MAVRSARCEEKFFPLASLWRLLESGACRPCAWRLEPERLEPGLRILVLVLVLLLLLLLLGRGESNGTHRAPWSPTERLPRHAENATMPPGRSLNDLETPRKKRDWMAHRAMSLTCEARAGSIITAAIVAGVGAVVSAGGLAS
eukprot:4996083-Pyramimonas_sp.AAC.1